MVISAICCRSTGLWDASRLHFRPHLLFLVCITQGIIFDSASEFDRQICCQSNLPLTEILGSSEIILAKKGI